MNTLKIFKPTLASHSKLYLNATIKRSLFHTGSILKQYENNTPPHLDTLAYLTPEQINNLVKKALKMKYQVKVENKEFTNLLKGQTVAMLFTKRSTRTRVATESAVTLLGIHYNIN
jgi:ornithine carbamoyltransferase